MGRSLDGGDAFDAGGVNELPQHDEQVDTFLLDVFEVTVGRFRRFVASYAGPPEAGAGAHPGIARSGWLDWVSVLYDGGADAGAPPLPAGALDVRLFQCGAQATWTDQPGPNEDRPMTCASWYEMFAFCHWDGARLPTEAEWELAAAAGLSNRLYPWGNDAPSPARAAYAPDGGGGGPDPVGAHPTGQSAVGVQDLAGNVWELMLDFYHPDWYGRVVEAGVPCINCANMTFPSFTGPGPGRVVRGGGWNSDSSGLRATFRQRVVPTFRGDYIGFRCAR